MKSDYDKLISRFNFQIKSEQNSNRAIEYCPSYWQKRLFEESHDLSISDWRVITDGDYYKLKDSLKGIEKSIYILRKIREHKHR